MRWSLAGIGQQFGAESVLRDVDLVLEPGLHVLLGPTGSGKTELLRILAGLDRPTSGRVLAGERDVTRAGVRGRSVAMVYQQFINYPSLCVFDNIAAPLRQGRRMDAAEVERRVRGTARMLRLDDLLDRLPAQLSGGQQQRTAIARALVKEADLLLLDEPLVNLDYKLREELRAELRGLFARGGSTIVYATTEPQEARILGGETILLHEGRVLQHGPSLEVYQRPRTARAADVLSDPPLNWLPLELDAQGARVGETLRFARPSHLRSLRPGAYRAGLRPHQLGVDSARGADAALDAEVELGEIGGSETFVHVRAGAGTSALALIARLPGVHRVEIGQRLSLHFDPEGLLVYDGEGKLVAAPGSAVERVA